MKSKHVYLMFLLSLFLLPGCNLPIEKATSTPMPLNTASIAEVSQSTPTDPPTEIPPEPTATTKPEIVHKDLPGAPIGKMMQTVYDQIDEKTAPNKQAFGGDNFRAGKYERPFDQSMNYLPLADLVSVQLSREDPLWIYILFKVAKPFTVDPNANTNFMIEIDTDLDNRGNYLIVSEMPESTEWSTDTVRVLSNPDLNVGGVTVVAPDKNLSEGRGYYTEIFNRGEGDDSDLAWSRLSKTDPSIAQIAFKNTLTGGEKGKFIWLPWTDAGMHDWSVFEFNDHFSYAQAGYPIKDDLENYPLKSLWGIDNTCRIPSGFTPTGVMPGLCDNYDPPPSRGSSPSTCACNPRDPKCVCP